MKASVCITVLNEKASISKLVESLLLQVVKPDEIIIVDGGSSDGTIDILRHYQKRSRLVKIFVEKCNRPGGRNLSVDFAKNEIIVTTDAGCVADKNWLKNIIQPFVNKEVEAVAGFYKMVSVNNFEKACSVFLGVFPNEFGINFLPSTRSMAFRKSIWEKVNGFPEYVPECEDTIFCNNLLRYKIVFTHVKDATVEWRMPRSVGEYLKKIFLYAKGDAKSEIWFLKSISLMSHNIKVILVYLRYLFGFVLTIYLLVNDFSLFPILFFVIIYLIYVFRKVFLKTKSIRVAFWGILIQLITDFDVMLGFAVGIAEKYGIYKKSY